jgi:alpha-N-arabinofuranosidase
VTGNTIHDIHVRALFTGAEMAGIKFHAAIDVEICGNHIYRTCRGLWLDWMAQGTRVSRNLIHDSARQDLFVEVNHGPFLVDNNVFLSPQSILTFSRGGAYVHNLMAGSVDVRDYDKRLTPFLKPHSTALAGMHDNPSGDERYFNNLLIGAGDLSPYDRARLPVVMQGNVFVGGAKPCRHEVAPLLVPKCDPALRLLEQGDATHLEMRFDPAWIRARVRGLITSDTLGQAAIPKLPFVAPDDSPIRIDTDYFGKRRDESAPTPGPFEAPGAGALRLKLR